MSTSIHTEGREVARLPFGQVTATIVASLVLAVAGGALSVWVTQARTTDKLAAVEQQVQRNKDEREQQVKELREHTIPRGEFEAYKQIMQDIRDDVRELRNAQLRGGR